MVSPKDKDWLNVYKNKSIYMVPAIDSLQTYRHI